MYTYIVLPYVINNIIYALYNIYKIIELLINLYNSTHCAPAYNIMCYNKNYTDLDL